MTTDTPTPTKTTPTKRPFSTRPWSPRYRAIVDLPADWLACMICGAATPPDEQHGQQMIHSQGRRPVGIEAVLQATRNGVGQPFDTTMTRCAECAERHAEAEHLARVMPRAVVVGDYSYSGPQAVMAIEASLAAASVAVSAGHTLAIREPRHLTLALGHLFQHGVHSRWSARFEGLADPDARSKTGAATPFAHLDEKDVAALRGAFSTYLKQRVEQPIPVSPSTGVGCMLCGIGEVLVRPSEAREVWHPLHSTVAALGGRGPGQVDGEICTTCHAERERVGMTGPTLIDRLVMRAAGIEGKLGADQLLLNQVPAFAVTGRTKPNSSPWSHINLKQLKSDFEGGRL